jgi:hypothetical protein
MDGDDREAGLREELRGVEEEIAGLRETAMGLRRQLGEHSSDPMDASERSALLTSAEEQEALAETLEARRGKLRERLDESEP